MLSVRRAADRGHANHGWLDTRFTFSFADYHDPRHMGFRSLRVINDDRVRGGAGFPPHPHRDMEILTYVLDGALEHRDSMGSGAVMRPHEVQRMSAGTGVLHSEFNPSEDEPLRLLQIWILPERRGITPGYEQKAFPPAEKQGRLRLVASPDAAEGSVTIHQDARVYASLLAPGERVEHALLPGRGAWLQVARGRIRVNGSELAEGDGAAIEDEPRLAIEGVEAAEFLLFDLK
jgi:redox-sensitive bicupin YhaK (pirin superfamily)